MPQSVDLLSPNMGIQSILDTTMQPELPNAQATVPSSVSETKLEELFAPANAFSMTEAMLRPSTGDGTILVPGTFASTLKSCAQTLSADSSPESQELANKELGPLLANSELLQAYVGLLIGG